MRRIFDYEDGEDEDDDDDSSSLLYQRVWPQFPKFDMTCGEGSDYAQWFPARINKGMRNTRRDFNDIGTFDSELLIAEPVSGFTFQHHVRFFALVDMKGRPTARLRFSYDKGEGLKSVRRTPWRAQTPQARHRS